MTTPDVPMYDYVDTFGNICTRLTMPAGIVAINCGFVIEDPFEADLVEPDAAQVPIEQLPEDALIYLLSSRYCETDRPAGGDGVVPVRRRDAGLGSGSGDP